MARFDKGKKLKRHTFQLSNYKAFHKKSYFRKLMFNFQYLDVLLNYVNSVSIFNIFYLYIYIYAYIICNHADHDTFAWYIGSTMDMKKRWAD